MARHTRISLFVSAVLGALLCLAALSATAFGAWGDSPANAFPLSGDAATSPPIPSYMGSSLTTDLIGSTSAGPNTSYYFRVLLSAGDLFRADFISSPTTDAPDGINLKALVLPDAVPSVRISSSLERLTFIAPTSDMYSVYVASSVAGTFTVEPVTITNPKEVLRIFGSNRYETAVKIGQSAYPGWSGVKHLVLASGDYAHQPDALTAAGLAGAYGAPVLLMPSNYLDPVVKAAIQAMPSGVQVHIVGGTPSISDAVATKVRALSKVKSVDRIYGADRYSTAAAVATRMKSVLGSHFPTTALLTNGANTSLLFDPLIASTASAAKHYPVLLLKPTSVPSPTASALSTLKLSTRYVVGGTSAVSDTVLGSLSVPAGNRISGIGVAGDAAAFAEKAKALGWLTNTYVGFASAVPDAATGGAYMGKLGGSLLLVSAGSIPSVTSDYVTANKSSIQGGRAFGGTPSISEQVRTDLESLLN